MARIRRAKASRKAKKEKASRTLVAKEKVIATLAEFAANKDTGVMTAPIDKQCPTSMITILCQRVKLPVQQEVGG